MTKYFDLHVFHNRKNGFSVPVKLKTDNEIVADEEVIDFALKANLIDSEDADSVDYVEEVGKETFIAMGGK